MALPLTITLIKKTEPHLIMPIVKDGRFYNCHENIWGNFFETMGLLFRGVIRKPTQLGNLLNHLICKNVTVPDRHYGVPYCIHIGHSTILIQAYGINILIDPAFGFVPPIFKRYVPPAIPLEKMPPIDLILLSHNHEDHAHSNSLKFLQKKFNPWIFAGTGTRDWLISLGFTDEKIYELMWWDTAEINNGDEKIFKITAVPAEHGSQKRIRDLNCSLWCGYIIEINNNIIYFAGDTAIGKSMLNSRGETCDLFQQIKEKWPAIDLSFIPIAPGVNRMHHADLVQAIQIMRTLNAKKNIPIHWGAYRMGSEQIEEPILKLSRLLRANHIQVPFIVLQKMGSLIYLKNHDHPLRDHEMNINFSAIEKIFISSSLSGE